MLYLLLFLLGVVAGAFVMALVQDWDKDVIMSETEITLNLFQIGVVQLFVGDDEPDTPVTIAYMPDGVDGAPPGLYVWLTDHPDEGAMYLPPDEEAADDEAAREEAEWLKQHYKEQTA